MEDRGFVQLACPKCGRKDQWLRCEKCQKTDHFLVKDGLVGCDCGATYGHGNCACGEKVPGPLLKPIAWKDGPRSLADLEIAWGRIAAVATVVIVVIGALIWGFLGTRS